MWRRKENRRERRYQGYTVTEENPTEFIKVKVNELNDASSYKLYDSIDWKFNWCFDKTSGNYNSKELSLKADGN